MTDKAKKILKLIETVDPTDTDTLDEIDALVLSFLEGVKPVGFNKERTMYEYDWGQGVNWFFASRIPKYTRSRDALKSIRPRGWYLNILNKGSDGCSCSMYRYDYTPVLTLPTEELAELHAIIQAIQWERTK